MSANARNTSSKVVSAPANTYTAYKVYPDDQSRAGHIRNLSLAEARDEVRFPLGPQREESGRLFVWSYGIGDGNKV